MAVVRDGWTLEGWAASLSPTVLHMILVVFVPVDAESEASKEMKRGYVELLSRGYVELLSRGMLSH